MRAFPSPKRPILLLALCAGAAFAQAEAPIELPFSAFFRQPVGPRGLEFSDALRAADGRPVRLVGYVVVDEHAEPGRFLLAPRPLRRSEHADGPADDLPPSTVTVLLDASQRTRIVAAPPGPVALTGTLSVGREEDAEGRVSWLRLHLAPQALAAAATSHPTFATSR
jgi:hypothetical protein